MREKLLATVVSSKLDGEENRNAVERGEGKRVCESGFSPARDTMKTSIMHFYVFFFTNGNRIVTVDFRLYIKGSGCTTRRDGDNSRLHLLVPSKRVSVTPFSQHDCVRRINFIFCATLLSFCSKKRSKGSTLKSFPFNHDKQTTFYKY